MPQSKWFRFGYGIALILLIIFLGSLVDFIFTPIAVMVTTLFAPIVLAGVLYYLIRPLVNFLSKYIPRSLSILLIYLVIIGLVTALVFVIGPPLQKQVSSLIDNTPGYVNKVREIVVDLSENEYVDRFQQNDNFSIEELTGRLTDNVNKFLQTVGNNLMSFISTLTGILVLVVLIPFILFYMLKDGEKLPGRILNFVPAAHREEGRKVLSDMDNALSSYIQGQILVSLLVGILIYIGYLIIGLDYSLVLAFISLITNVIPFVGPFIGLVPALVVGFLDSPMTGVWVIVVVLIVQQLEGNLISPQIMGRQLDVHPLTIILLLMVAGSLAGLLGLLLAVPTYAVSKVIVVNTWRFIKLRRADDNLAAK
ncbi:AI-2E family transporter [Peribacillus saganii]|uniref:AI-2E family transporter n=1 Tax=Peribacillus saganii TaxID=2303992 RepID=A0A372LJ36_9BACI|nr:AI-2E family transporter [Peribacillus saganii]RFU66383.1 AI-2E family transporter [Peribacillus saganii]